jgi:hypothetical protein
MSMRRILTFGIAVALTSTVFLTGCDILDASNPNSLVEEDLQDPRGASALKNGLLNALMDGTGWAYAPLSASSDEMRWQGSYESYQGFQIGRLDRPGNEITNNTWPVIAEARWLADEAIDRLTTLEEEGELPQASILTRTYLYSALTRIQIADTYDNFVYSDKREAGEPIGSGNMVRVYDEAIDHLSIAIDRARSNGNEEIEMQALGVRARAKHAKAVWNKLNPPGSTPSDPLVSDALSASASDAVGDAEAALSMMPSDYEAEFDYRGPQVLNYVSDQVNDRAELAINDDVEDPKTGNQDPRIARIAAEFTNIEQFTANFAPITWLSAREMRLIIAEEAMGRNESEARQELNDLRALDDLPPIEPGDDLVAFLEHERRANLFLQGRRLNDMFRFGTTSPTWQAGESALENPGELFPIPSSEISTNPNVDPGS